MNPIGSERKARERSAPAPALEPSTVVRPVQNRLSLSSSTHAVTRLAVSPNGSDVTSDGAPPPDLAAIVGAPAARIVPAVPLKPPAWILRMDPAIPTPHGEGLRRVHTEAVQPCVSTARREFRPREPAPRELVDTISHIPPAKHSECEHLFRRQVRRERGMKVAPGGFDTPVHIPRLHPIIDGHPGPAAHSTFCRID